MSNKHITRKSLGETSGDRTDWERIKRLTDEEVHQAALADPDAPPTTEGDWEDAVVIRPRGPKPIASKNVEVKVRFRTLEEKQHLLEFIEERYPELSLNAFFKLAAREKIDRECS